MANPKLPNEVWCYRIDVLNCDTVFRCRDKKEHVLSWHENDEAIPSKALSPIGHYKLVDPDREQLVKRLLIWSTNPSAKFDSEFEDIRNKLMKYDSK